MRILSMTATFGKLEHATLTLEPGLNVIHAPNEWGKSTWCAFMVNMFYGIDTRARSTGTTLADKERYAPWSGAAMSGRMELEWEGKKITIERRTVGRVPFGDFRAYETDTGLDVPELDGVNCGQKLLGVERSVFTRAGFLKLADLPVTQDEALRRRLNNLVTTGDESGAGDKLGQTLKDLKNKCRFNNKGLLPQAEKDRDQHRSQLQQLQQLQTEAHTIEDRQGKLVELIADLKNHQAALEYDQAADNVRQVEAAQQALADTTALVQTLETQCADLPQPQDLEQNLQALEQLLEQRNTLFMQSMPDMPQAPSFMGDAQQAMAEAKADVEAYNQLQEKLNKPTSFVDILLGILTLGILPFLRSRKKKAWQQELDAIAAKHPGKAQEQWIAQAETYAQEQAIYQQKLSAHQEAVDAMNQKKAQLDQQIADLVGETSPEECRKAWRAAMDTHKQLATAKADLVKTQEHAQVLKGMIRTVDAPAYTDKLTLTAAQTQEALNRALFEQQQLQLRLGQAMGQAESIGQESLLRARLDTLNRRIARLEDTYYALEMAQEALYKASTSLQRRFAPMISKHTQELFAKLTGGRYQRLAMGEDLSLRVGAEDEDTLYAAQWRSDGTVDQLYLALRLAVARELTPHAPLVLDDALVRFDDIRAKQAMEILTEESQNKQVILFTCQSREMQNA
ncbi:MAG: AAA family ATPase [Oscillospiraceae bacterium]|nr:AAA family ATPase [Oscillospiraceae bacterium]